METKLTIIMPSYNREQWIAKSLDSILMQETGYGYEIIIADDASTDNTLKIAKEYQKNYPQIIKILESTHNQKLYKNVLRAYEITKTDYFCTLDPDDWWVDKHKIQKALDFLESHRDYTIYTGNTEVIKGNERFLFLHGNTRSNDFKDYLDGKAFHMPTQSAFFRNCIFKNGVPKKMKNLQSPSCEVSYRADSFKNLIHIHEGKAYFSGEVDSVYNVHENGIWQSLNNFKQELIGCVFYKDAWLYYDKQYNELLWRSYKSYRMLSSMNLEKFLTICVCGGGDKNYTEDYLRDLESLKSIFEPHLKELESMWKNKMRWKYRLLFIFYTKISAKLAKKGYLKI